MGVKVLDRSTRRSPGRWYLIPGRIDSLRFARFRGVEEEFSILTDSVYVLWEAMINPRSRSFCIRPNIDGKAWTPLIASHRCIGIGHGSWLVGFSGSGSQLDIFSICYPKVAQGGKGQLTLSTEATAIASGE